MAAAVDPAQVQSEFHELIHVMGDVQIRYAAQLARLEALREDGAFQGSGSATEGDFGGLGHLTSHPIQYSIFGRFRGSQGGPPTGGPVVYSLTLNGTSGANTNGAASFTGSRSLTC